MTGWEQPLILATRRYGASYRKITIVSVTIVFDIVCDFTSNFMSVAQHVLNNRRFDVFQYPLEICFFNLISFLSIKQMTSANVNILPDTMRHTDHRN